MKATNTGSAQERPLVSVLVVNFNSTQLLRESLRALSMSSVVDRLETIVVDNASADFDLAKLAGEFPWVHWLPQPVNTTCTGGNNIAYAEAASDLVLMLNPDTRVEPDAIERAVDHLNSSADLVAVGAYFIGPDGEVQRYYRRLPTLLDVPVLLFEPLFRRTRRGRRFLMEDESFSGRTLVEHCAGVFLLMRRLAVGPVLLNPAYFNLFSDVELSRRLNETGYVAVFDDVRCHHLGGGGGMSTENPRARLRLYQDFCWGIRQYFSSERGLLGRAFLNVAMLGYWVSRVIRIARRDPASLGAAVSVAAVALRGRPPRY
jgi:GT2 family glycosyltransferase